MNFNSLPDEICIEVFNFCSSLDKLRNLSYINKKCQRIVNSSGCWIHVREVRFCDSGAASYFHDEHQVNYVDSILLLGIDESDHKTLVPNKIYINSITRLLSLLTNVNKITGLEYNDDWSMIVAQCKLMIPKWAKNKGFLILICGDDSQNSAYKHLPALLDLLKVVNLMISTEKQLPPVRITAIRSWMNYLHARMRSSTPQAKQDALKLFGQMLDTGCVIEILDFRSFNNWKHWSLEDLQYFMDAIQDANIAKAVADVLHVPNLNVMIPISAQILNKLKIDGLKSLDLYFENDSPLLDQFLEHLDETKLRKVNELTLDMVHIDSFKLSTIQSVLVKFPELTNFTYHYLDLPVSLVVPLDEHLAIVDLFVRRMQQLSVDLELSLMFPNFLRLGRDRPSDEQEFQQRILSCYDKRSDLVAIIRNGTVICIKETGKPTPCEVRVDIQIDTQ